MPIDTVTGKRRETIIKGRISVIENNPEGKSYREIAEITRTSKLQAAEIVKERQQRNIEDLNRSGRPSKFSDSDVCYLKMRSDRFIPTTSKNYQR
jgi:transposase